MGRHLLAFALVLAGAMPAAAGGDDAASSGDGSLPPVDYACSDGRKLVAVFDNGAAPVVHLTFADGRELTLPQAVSGSGARYADEATGDEFWIKGNDAMATFGGITTDCTTG